MQADHTIHVQGENTVILIHKVNLQCCSEKQYTREVYAMMKGALNTIEEVYLYSLVVDCTTLYWATIGENNKP